MAQRYLFISIVLFPVMALCHPVSFKDGFAVMPSYTKERQELEINYTYDSDNAVGFNTINIDSKKDITFLLPQFNHKFYRRNGEGSQTNIYGSLGMGIADQNDETDFANLIAVQADYETRRIYTLFSAEHLRADADEFNRLRYRIGVAPYLGNFEELNTWLIAQVEYTPELNDTWTITPMVRFFYSNYLIEVGASLKGDLFLAGIFHF